MQELFVKDIVQEKRIAFSWEIKYDSLRKQIHPSKSRMENESGLLSKGGVTMQIQPMAVAIQEMDPGTAALVLVLQLAMMVMLGLAVFNDAKAHAGQQAVFWGILVGFFGLIPGIIYLCMRKKEVRSSIACTRCRQVYNITVPYCPVCGLHNRRSEPFWDPRLPSFRKKATVFFTLWLCLYGALFLLLMVYALFHPLLRF